MRFVLALGLLIAICAPASAAKVHSRPRQVIAPPGAGVTPALSEQERKRLHDINIPSYNDPSRFGGA